MADNLFDQFDQHIAPAPPAENVFDRFHEPDQSTASNSSPSTNVQATHPPARALFGGSGGNQSGNLAAALSAGSSTPNVFDRFHEPTVANKPGFSDVQGTLSVSPARGPSDDVTPIGDAPPEFGDGKVTPGEMAAAGTEFRRLGTIGARAAGSRALNLGATLNQGLNPSETIAAKLTGLPDELTQSGQMRQVAQQIAPHVAPDDRGGRLAEFAGGLAPDAVAAAVTGGLAEVPAGASFGLRALHGAMSMALPAAENAREGYNESIANGLTPAQAAAQAAVAGGGTLAMGAIPANVPGDLATRALSGGAIAGLQTEGQRRLSNALLPSDRPNLQQQFDAFNLGAGVLTGGVMAGVLGHGGVMDGVPGNRTSGVSSPGPAPSQSGHTTNFVAGADGFLHEVPSTPEQPTPPAPFPNAEPGTLAHAANTIADASGSRTRAGNVFDQFDHTPVAADAGRQSASVDLEEHGSSPSAQPLAAAAKPTVPFPDAAEGSLAHAANALDDLRKNQAGTEQLAGIPSIENGQLQVATQTENLFDAFHNAPTPEFRVEPLGPKGLLVHGDPDAARAQLSAAGFQKPGRMQDGALRFDAGDRGAIENALLLQPAAQDTEPALGSITHADDGTQIVQTSVGPRKLNDTDYDVGYGGSSQRDGTVVLQRGFDYTIPDGPLKGLDTRPFLAEHEAVERNLEDKGNSYTDSHHQAQDAEHAMLLDTLGLKPGSPEADRAIDAYEAHNKELLEHSAAVQDPKVAPDLLQLPYDHPHTVEQRRLLADVQDSDRPAAEPVPDGKAQLENGRRAQPDREEAAVAGQFDHPGAEADVQRLAERGSDLESAVRATTKEWGSNAPAVRVLHTPEDLPDAAKREAPDRYQNVQGYYDGKTAYLVAPNVKDVPSALKTLAHEVVGHHGIDNIIDEHVKGGWDRLVTDVDKLRHDQSLGSAAMRDAINAVERRYRTYDPGTDKYSPADPKTFAKELLAVMAERGIKNGIIQRAVAALRAWVRKAFPNLQFSEADLHGLLRKSDAFIRSDDVAGDARQAAVRALAFAKADPTESTAFKKYFDGSKVVDRTGKPQIVYHGTGDDFTVFDPKRAGQSGEHATSPLGHFFTEDRDLAQRYAEKAADGVPAYERVIDAYLAIKKPYEMPLREAQAIQSPAEARALRGRLEREGYDGIRIPEAKSWIAFDSGQAKSIDNRGTFDRSNPDIRFSMPDPEEEIRGAEDRPGRRVGESPSAYAQRLSRSSRDEIRAATSLRTQQQVIGRHALREMFAKRARAMDTADAVFAEYRKVFDKTEPARNYAAVDEWETGKKVSDPVFREFLSKMNSGFAERIERLQALDPNALKNLVANYVPHLYRDPQRATSVLSQLVGRHSLAGDKSFLKQRTWPTLREAMESGLQPISSNPVDWALLKYATMDKYAGMLELKKELSDRGWLPKLGNDESPPFGFRRVADPAFNGTAVPDTLARDITNYLDPGFSKYAAWRTLRGIQNFMVAADLGFSGFHATFTSTDNIVMHFDVAARRAAIGDSRGAAATLGKALTSVVTSPFEGHKLNQQWRGLREADPNTAAILDALERGGARWKMSTTEYQNAIPKMARMLRQMMGTGVRPQIAGKTPAQIAIGALRVPVTALQAAAETGSYLIHHVLVPNQKMAARVLLYKYELDRRAQDLGQARGDYSGILDAMHPDVVRQLAAQVNDVVDFRLGQMAYDNRFWNRTAQDIAQAAVMAPGWQYGMLQTVLGASKAVKDLVKPQRLVAPLDKAGDITDAHMGRVGSNLSYFLTLALTLGGSMAATQYLLTGKGPDSIKDYFFPKTGRKNDDDSDERLQFPNYWVDHYKLATEPGRTAENKIHPLWKMIWEIGHNRDYFGTQIHNPNAPAFEQAREVGAYLASHFVPITIGNMQKGVRRDETATQQVGHFFGVNNAPAGVARSEFQNFVMRGGSKGWGEYTRTQEEAESRQTARSASAAIRRGDEPQFGDLDPKAIAKVRNDAKQPVPVLLFKRLSDPDKLYAYDMATPAEREHYGLDAMMRRVNLNRSAPFKKLPAAEQAQLRQRLQTIRGGVAQGGNVFDQFDHQ